MTLKIFFLFCLSLFLLQLPFPNCSDQPARQNRFAAAKKKPAACSNETVLVDRPAVVFYAPDSLQNEKIRSITDAQTFTGAEHDFVYQQRFGHSYIKESWPLLQCIEVQKVRYLLFVKKNRQTIRVDLNELSDAYGMLVFDGAKDPQLIDMANMVSQVPDYFALR